MILSQQSHDCYYVIYVEHCIGRICHDSRRQEPPGRRVDLTPSFFLSLPGRSDGWVVVVCLLLDDLGAYSPSYLCIVLCLAISPYSLWQSGRVVATPPISLDLKRPVIVVRFFGLPRGGSSLSYGMYSIVIHDKATLPTAINLQIRICMHADTFIQDRQWGEKGHTGDPASLLHSRSWLFHAPDLLAKQRRSTQTYVHSSLKLQATRTSTLFVNTANTACSLGFHRCSLRISRPAKRSIQSTLRSRGSTHHGGGVVWRLPRAANQPASLHTTCMDTTEAGIQ